MRLGNVPGQGRHLPDEHLTAEEEPPLQVPGRVSARREMRGQTRITGRRGVV